MAKKNNSKKGAAKPAEAPAQASDVTVVEDQPPATAEAAPGPGNASELKDEPAEAPAPEGGAGVAGGGG
jgi:hypothetical protein